MKYLPPSGPWLLDPTVTFLNHGSFGATPRAVVEVQREWRDRMEADPVAFFARDLEAYLDGSRVELAAFIGADPDDVAFLPNATTGLNTVLRSIRFRAGDELLATDHEYNAALNALDFVAKRDGATVVLAEVPFPIESPQQVIDAVLGRVTRRTRLALVSHVTSPTGLIFPIAELVRELAERGVDTLVDGAHAPGMLPLDLKAIGAAYYTGNCHKWLCAPKGSGFLHVRRDRQEQVRPLAISHGANSTRQDRTRFRLEFDWVGTIDPTPYLALPAALRHVNSLLPGGWDELMQANRTLNRLGRDILCRSLEVPPPAPDEMLGSMASVILPPQKVTTTYINATALGESLLRSHRIQVPVFDWPGDAARAHVRRRDVMLLRISAQIYNTTSDYLALGNAIALERAGNRSRASHHTADSSDASQLPEPAGD